MARDVFNDARVCAAEPPTVRTASRRLRMLEPLSPAAIATAGE
jgi:hypothetical protein